MKYGILVCCLFAAVGLPAQEKPKPAWVAGIYGGVSYGYALMQDPLANAPLGVSIYPANGPVLVLEAGVTFRRRLGCHVSLARLSQNDFIQEAENQVKGQVPGAFYQVQQNGNTKKYRLIHSVGISYAFPRKRWVFQPDVTFGILNRAQLDVSASAKGNGNHELSTFTFRSTQEIVAGRSLQLGIKTSWYLFRDIGLFAQAGWHHIWPKLETYRMQTNQITGETITQTGKVKTAYEGVSLRLGIFYQVGRWE